MKTLIILIFGVATALPLKAQSPPGPTQQEAAALASAKTLIESHPEEARKLAGQQTTADGKERLQILALRYWLLELAKTEQIALERKYRSLEKAYRDATNASRLRTSEYQRRTADLELAIDNIRKQVEAYNNNLP